MLRGLHGVVTFFSRISFLVDENTHAVHFFISALLQLLDRCASELPHLLLLCDDHMVAERWWVRLGWGLRKRSTV